MLEIIIRFHNIKSNMRNLNWYLIIFQKNNNFWESRPRCAICPDWIMFLFDLLDLDEFMFLGEKNSIRLTKANFSYFHLNFFFFEDGVLSCNSGDLLKISSFWNGVVSMNWRNTCKIPKYSNFCLTIRVKRWVSIFYFHCF